MEIEEKIFSREDYGKDFLKKMTNYIIELKEKGYEECRLIFYDNPESVGVEYKYDVKDKDTVLEWVTLKERDELIHNPNKFSEELDKIDMQEIFNKVQVAYDETMDKLNSKKNN